MPRKRTIRQGEFPYHIYNRCINKQWFDIPIREVWEITTEYLHFIHHAFRFQIHGYVLMDNHFHLFATTPESNVDDCMEYFQREVSRRIGERSGRINQVFGGPYQWSIGGSVNSVFNIYKYVYRNPVEAGLSRRCEDYPFSTLHGLLGRSHLIVPVQEDKILFNPGLNVAVLEWLNSGKKADVVEVERALKKARFRFAKDTSTGLPVRDDDFVY